MKHRSIGVFILLAATLAAAPQASQELAALKNSVVGRVRAELLQAVLNLRASGGAKRFAPRPAQLAEASCDMSKEVAARRGQPNAKSVRRDASPRQRDEAAPRPDDHDDSAMIIDPNSPLPGPVSIASVEMNLDGAMLGKAAGLLEEKITAGDLAMIIQPQDDIMRVADARRPSPRVKRNAEVNVRTQYVAAPDAKGGPDFLWTSEEARRGFDEAMRAAAAGARAEGDVERVKVLRLKRTGRFVAGSAVKAPQPRKAPAPLWPDTDERHFIPAGE